MTLASIALLALFCGAVAAGSLMGVSGVLVVVAVVAVVAAMEVSSGARASGTKVVSMAVAAGAGMLPVVARFRGEGGLLEAVAVLIIVLGAMHVIRSPRERVTVSVSTEALFAFLLGAAGAYLVLLAARPDGQRLLVIIGAMVLAVRAASYAIDRTGRRSIGHAGGAAASVAVGLAASLLFASDLGTAELVIVGAVVAGAASLSSVAADMIRAEVSGGRSLGVASAALEPFLFGAPAFFYAVKLYLS